MRFKNHKKRIMIPLKGEISSCADHRPYARRKCKHFAVPHNIFSSGHLTVNLMCTIYVIEQNSIKGFFLFKKKKP